MELGEDKELMSPLSLAKWEAAWRQEEVLIYKGELQMDKLLLRMSKLTQGIKDLELMYSAHLEKVERMEELYPERH